MHLRWLVLLGFIAATLTAGALGGLATASSVSTWYPTLAKPSWNPPNWIFGPVWTFLYLLMAVAAWRIWRHHEHPERRRAFAWFWGQLALNVAWSFLFFGLRSPGLAAIEVVGLLVVLLATLRQFWRIDRLAAVLWLPYVGWVGFATVLTATVWSLNR